MTCSSKESLDSIEAHTKVEVSGPKLFKISHSNPDPRRAKDVVQAFLGIFVEGNLGRGREDIESTRDFIDKQIAGYEAQLQATEKRIADFRAKYSDAISSSGTSFSARLEKARADVDELSSEVAAAKNRKLAAQSQKGPQSLEDNSPQSETKDPTLAKLRADLNQKLAIYSDQHPDIIALKQQIASLETQDAQSAEQRLVAATDTLKHLKDMANSAPLLEAQLADLTRDS